MLYIVWISCDMPCLLSHFCHFLYPSSTGLPPSPPSLSSNLAAIDDHPYPANYKGNSGSSLKPMGVDIPRTQNNGSGRSMGAVIIISAITAFLTCAGIAWIIITRRRFSAPHPEEALTTALSSFTKPSGTRNDSAFLRPC